MRKLLITFVLLFSSVSAHALIITISGASNPDNDGLWDVTTVFGSYDSLSTTLQDQVWFGDFDLATLFALTVDDAFGFPNGLANRGPAFVVTNDGSRFGISGRPIEGVRANTVGGFALFVRESGNPQVHAIASRVPEPGTLALLGIGLAGIGFAKRKKT